MTNILSQENIDAELAADPESYSPLSGVPLEAVVAFSLATREYPDAAGDDGRKLLEFLGIDFTSTQQYGNTLNPNDPAQSALDYVVGFLSGRKFAEGHFPVLPTREEAYAA